MLFGFVFRIMCSKSSPVLECFSAVLTVERSFSMVRSEMRLLSHLGVEHPIAVVTWTRDRPSFHFMQVAQHVAAYFSFDPESLSTNVAQIGSLV